MLGCRPVNVSRSAPCNEHGTYCGVADRSTRVLYANDPLLRRELESSKWNDESAQMRCWKNENVIS